jgi:hypothetical protein
VRLLHLTVRRHRDIEEAALLLSPSGRRRRSPEQDEIPAASAHVRLAGDTEEYV